MDTYSRMSTLNAGMSQLNMRPSWGRRQCSLWVGPVSLKGRKSKLFPCWTLKRRKWSASWNISLGTSIWFSSPILMDIPDQMPCSVRCSWRCGLGQMQNIAKFQQQRATHSSRMSLLQPDVMYQENPSVAKSVSASIPTNSSPEAFAVGKSICSKAAGLASTSKHIDTRCIWIDNTPSTLLWLVTRKLKLLALKNDGVKSHLQLHLMSCFCHWAFHMNRPAIR